MCLWEFSRNFGNFLSMFGALNELFGVSLKFFCSENVNQKKIENSSFSNGSSPRARPAPHPHPVRHSPSGPDLRPEAETATAAPPPWHARLGVPRCPRPYKGKCRYTRPTLARHVARLHPCCAAPPSEPQSRARRSSPPPRRFVAVVLPRSEQAPPEASSCRAARATSLHVTGGPPGRHCHLVPPPAARARRCRSSAVSPRPR
jgi:hypothetical protein